MFTLMVGLTQGEFTSRSALCSVEVYDQIRWFDCFLFIQNIFFTSQLSV